MPVWMRFDTALKKPELLEIIKILDSLSFKIVFVTSDRGSDNAALANKLGITPEHPYFEHPVRNWETIFYMYDVPHLIKLMRNALLKWGFILPELSYDSCLELGLNPVDEATQNRCPVIKDMFDTVRRDVDKSRSEINIAHKLRNPALYEVNSLDKQRVKTACQLLSGTMATTMRRLYPGNVPMMRLSDFVKKANQWFDILNSTNLSHINPWKCAYGVSYDDQKKALLEFKQYVLDTEVMNPQNDTTNYIGKKKSFLFRDDVTLETNI